MTAPTRERSDTAAVTWAMVGTALVLALPAARLAARSASVLQGAGAAELGGLVAVAAFVTYTEGHLALHRRFVPRAYRRATAIGTTASRWWRIVAPLYAMSLLGDARAMARAWTGVAAIVAAALLVGRLADPWRAIIDGGVACALTYGAGSSLVTIRRDPRGRRTDAGVPALGTSTNQAFGRSQG